MMKTAVRLLVASIAFHLTVGMALAHAECRFLPGFEWLGKVCATTDVRGGSRQPGIADTPSAPGDGGGSPGGSPGGGSSGPGNSGNGNHGNHGGNGNGHGKGK